MKAVTYQGIKDVQVKEVNDPKIEKPDDMIVRKPAQPSAARTYTLFTA